MMKQALRDYFKTNREEIARRCEQRLGELVAVRSVNAGRDRLAEFPYLTVPGEESQVVAVLAGYFDRIGVPYQIHAQVEKRANLIASLGSGRPVLLVGLHCDVVPPGDGWDSDPWQVTRKGDNLIGRGVLDDKGPMVSCLAAMEALIALRVPLKGTLQFAAIASEEHREPGEPDPGIEYLLEAGLLKPDFAIIPDVGENMKRIDIAEKGRMVVEVNVKGRQAHGSTPERGINAVGLMAPFVQRLADLRMPHTVHEYLGSPTLNLGLIRGGVAANVVPGDCSVTLDIRFVPGQTVEGIVEQLRGLTKDLAGTWKLEVASVSKPHGVDPELPLIGVIQAEAVAVLGQRPELIGIGGGTFAKSFNLGGLPAVGFGPGDDEAYHVANEWVSLTQLVDFAELLAGVTVELLC